MFCDSRTELDTIQQRCWWHVGCGSSYSHSAACTVRVMGSVFTWLRVQFLALYQVASAICFLYYVRCNSSGKVKTPLCSSCTGISTLLSKTGLPGYKSKLADTIFLFCFEKRKKKIPQGATSPFYCLPEIISDPVKQRGPRYLSPESQGPR